ncbi:MAG: hypothetical protein HY679_12080 [Chloroflexi bacterium]|nr:hypothetical protein [Chloroflexota bacterium]
MATRPCGWIALMALGLAVLACGGPTPPPSTTAPRPTATASLPTELPTATTPLPTELPTASAARPQIVNTAVIHKPGDSWRLVGELANNTGQTVSNVALHIEWFDASGASLGSDSADLLTTHVAPGETAPFIYNVYTTGLQIAHFTAAITQSTADATPRSAASAVLVKSPSVKVDAFGNFHCVGELDNISGQPVDIEGLAAGLFDHNGAMFSADSFWAAGQHLEPGGSTPYRISPEGLAGAVAADYTCKVYVDAVAAAPATPPAIIVKDANGNGNFTDDLRFYQDVYGGIHLVGEVMNAANQPMTIKLIAGLYDAGGNVIDADYILLPVAVPPGETQAFDFNTLLTATAGFARATVQADPYSTAPAAAAQAPIKLGNVAIAHDKGAIVLTIDVLNDQPAAVKYATVMATATDATGAAVAFNYTSTNEIAAGATGSVILTLYLDPALDPNELNVNVVALAPQP